MKGFKMSNTHHVVKHKDGWAVKKGGSDRASKVCSTKKECEELARGISRNQKTELFIHNKDGKISRKDSHGNDPYPPRG